MRAWAFEERTADDVLLVLSELVSNAVLHAGDAQGATLVLYDDRIRVEVADPSTVAPAPSGYDVNAHTGRGLGLVEALALEWGVAHQDGGKVVWADLALPGVEPRSPPAVHDTDGGGHDDRPDDRRWAQFLHVPVRDYLALREQNDAVLRDVDLLLIGARRGLDTPVPDALLAACRRLRDGFGNPAGAYRDVVLAAAAAGQEHVDLRGPLPRAGAHLARAYIEMLEEVERFVADGHLFVEAPSPEVLELRRWFVQQAMDQEGGAEPTPAC
jgi:hypothetical protein